MGFGVELKRLRIQHNFTLRELGAATGIDHTYLSKIEGDKVGPPRQPTFERLAQALGVSAGELYLLAGAQRDENLSVVEVLRTLLQSPGAYNPEQWREIGRIAKGGLDSQYYLRNLLHFGEDLPTDNPSKLLKQKRGLAAAVSALPGEVKRSLWNLLYLLLQGNIKFEINRAEVVQTLMREGKRIVFVAQPRDTTALVSFLLECEAEIGGINRFIVMLNDNAEGKEAQQFLQKARIRIDPVFLPAIDKFNLKRSVALKNMVKMVREAGKGTAAIMFIDKRQNSRGKSPSTGPIILAEKCQGVIVPEVVRNEFEIVLEKSWDKHRIPLAAGKICLGKPFELSADREREAGNKRKQRGWKKVLLR